MTEFRKDYNASESPSEVQTGEAETGVEYTQTQEHTVYTPTLRREKEKAAICFRKMKYSRPTYKGFLALWHDRWATDFKGCNRNRLLKQIQSGHLDGAADDIWMQRYNYYLYLFRKLSPKDLEKVISSCRENGQFPSGFHKRLKALGLRIEIGDTKQKLGGYQLIRDGRRPEVVDGRKYELTLSEVLAILDEMENKSKEGQK